jgi:RNA polymerase sigma factor (sigma-70 family)
VGPDVAEDHLHETLLIVLKAIQCGNLREPERLLGFVRTVARRRVASSIRDAAQERHKEAELRWAYETRDRPDDPENALLARQQSEIMQTVLLELSPRDREVLARFYLLEQSQGQICQEMGLTETQFRLTKSRAKARFSKLGKHKLCAIGCSASR